MTAIEYAKNKWPVLGLMLATVFWGASFSLVKGAIGEVGTWPFLFWRFAIAATVMIILFPKKFLSVRKSTLKAAFLLGLLLYIAIFTWTIGLTTTSASKSGFLTVVYVPFTPLLGWLFFRQSLSVRQVFLAALSVFGLYLLMQPGAAVNVGDLWTLGTAFTYATQIQFTERYARQEKDGIALGLWEFVFCFIFVAATVFVQHFQVGPAISLDWNPLHWSRLSQGSLIFNACLTTCFSFVIQILCQRTVGSLKAALIFALEAPFAALVAFFFLGELLAPLEFIGAGLVFLVSIVPESWLKTQRKSLDHGPL